MLGESHWAGLASIFCIKCKGCRKCFDIEMGNKVRDPNGHLRYEINLAAVWGSISAGIGSSKLAEVLSTAGVPIMTDKILSKTEMQIGEWWKKTLDEEMKLVAEEEKQLAI